MASSLSRTCDSSARSGRHGRYGPRSSALPAPMSGPCGRMVAVTPAIEQPENPAPDRSAFATPRPRLIATDLDGTLLRDDKTVSDRTVAALAAAARAGIEVFFVTGRPSRWMDVVSAHVHGHGLAICANGAAVVDLHQGGLLVEVRPLAADRALTVVETLRLAAPGTPFAVERSGGIFYEPEYPPFHLDPGAVIAPAEQLVDDAFPGPDTPALSPPAHHRAQAGDNL